MCVNWKYSAAHNTLLTETQHVYMYAKCWCMVQQRFTSGPRDCECLGVSPEMWGICVVSEAVFGYYTVKSVHVIPQKTQQLALS